MPEKIILDCDPGHDDAVALMLAHGSPAIDLLAVTTVMGNQTIEKVTRNALAVARVIGLDSVPFARGSERPLVREVETAPDIHGESGLDGPVLPEPAIELDGRHAVDLIIDTVMAHEPGTVTLVPTGALTNIALAVRREPRIVERVKQVVLMGGGVHIGNWSATSEFNIVIDPEAAHIVFTAGWPLTMVGLDVTMATAFTAADFDDLARRDPHLGAFLREAGLFYLEFYYSRGRDGVGLHDPMTIIAAAHPELFVTEELPLRVVETGEEQGRTQEVAPSEAAGIARVCVGGDMEAIKRQFSAVFGD